MRRTRVCHARLAAMQYHPSRQWLIEHEHDPRLFHVTGEQEGRLAKINPQHNAVVVRIVCPFGIEIHGTGRGLLHQHDAACEQDREHHAHCRAAVEPAVAPHQVDRDGDPDLYVANDFGRNNLYRNDGGRFRDVAAEMGVEDMSAGMGVTWGDFNNDGAADLYVSNMFSSAGNRIAYQRQFRNGPVEANAPFQRHARGNTLFENTGDGTFKDVSIEAGVTMGRWAWGSHFADLNNDGWEDLYVANGFFTTEDTGDL